MADDSGLPSWMSSMMGGSMLGGALGGLFGGQNPANSANQYLNQIPGDTSQYMNPFINAGQNALGALSGQYSSLLNNPGGMVNQIGQSYHQSPGFNFALQNALQGANRGMAAGGLAGSPSNTIQNQQTATGMANQDYNNYMQNALGMYGQGLSGEQGLAGLGMQGATNMANIIANQLQNQAAMGYAGQANQNQSNSSMWGDIGGLAGMAANLFGG